MPRPTEYLNRYNRTISIEIANQDDIYERYKKNDIIVKFFEIKNLVAYTRISCLINLNSTIKTWLEDGLISL